MSNFAPKRTNYDNGDRRWLRDLLKARSHGVTVTTASFPAGSIAADGLVKSGTRVAGEGLLENDLVIKAGEQHLVAVVDSATVDRRFLPTQLTAVQEASFKGLIFINGTVPA